MAIIHALAAIYDHAGEADCRVIPTVILSFNTGGDRLRFEVLLKQQLDPMVGICAIRNRPEHEYELEGVTLKLTITEVS